MLGNNSLVELCTRNYQMLEICSLVDVKGPDLVWVCKRLCEREKKAILANILSQYIFYM